MQEFYKCDFSSFKCNIIFSEENEGHKTTGFPELVTQNNSLESVNKKNPTTLMHLNDTKCFWCLRRK